MKKILLLATLLIAIPLFGLAGSSHVSAASDIKNNLCGGVEQNLDGGSCGTGGAAENSLNNLIANIVNILTIIVGIVAVIMIIIGGFKFITSGGDSGKITSARQTVTYAIVGLIIVALAQFIVRFILSKA
jgi:hypothetical protein